jgi:hypothetical protein
MLRGSFWACTHIAYEFNITKRQKTLTQMGYEIVQNPATYRKYTYVENPYVENPYVENPEVENQHMGNQRLIIYNTNNTNSKHTKKRDISKDISPKKSNSLKNTNLSSKKNKNEMFLPIAIKLSHIIQSSKNIKHTQKQINDWVSPISKLVQENEINPKRINRALNWYADHVGEKYVPVIESGKSLQEKFLKLEAAIERDSDNYVTHSQKLNKGDRHYGHYKNEDKE